MAAVATWPGEALMIQVLEDDRLLQRKEDLRPIMATETIRLSNLHPYVWQRLASVIDDDIHWGEVFDNCM